MLSDYDLRPNNEQQISISLSIISGPEELQWMLGSQNLKLNPEPSSF